MKIIIFINEKGIDHNINNNNNDHQIQYQINTMHNRNNQQNDIYKNSDVKNEKKKSGLFHRL